MATAMFIRVSVTRNGRLYSL